MFRLIFVALLIFGFFAWDMGKNHGTYTRSMGNSIDHAAKRIGLR